MDEKNLKRKQPIRGNRGRGAKRGRSLAGNITIREQPQKSKEELGEILLDECAKLGLVYNIISGQLSVQ